MKNVLVVCPTERDKRELSLLSLDSYNIIYDDFCPSTIESLMFANGQGTDLRLIINEIISRHDKRGIDGVISTEDYPGIALASIVSDHLNLSGPKPGIVIRCQHKYYSRLDQSQLMPECIPEFQLIDCESFDLGQLQLNFPFVLKPVKSRHSIHANPINSMEEFQQLIKQSQFPKRYLAPFDYLLETYTNCELNSYYLLVESLLQGNQVTVEGFCFNGTCTIIGIVDSIMYPGSISFKRFEYPSSLPDAIQQKMIDYTQSLIKGISFDNAFFNVEFVYDEKSDTIGIIEINPRMCAQFADLYERVDGVNTYHYLLQLATGTQPILSKGQGPFNMAASCIFRTFTDQLVLQVPTDENKEKILHQYPDARIEINALKGKRLSQVKQDGKSYRYAIINLGGNNQYDILTRLDKCSSDLGFKFEPIQS